MQFKLPIVLNEGNFLGWKKKKARATPNKRRGAN